VIDMTRKQYECKDCGKKLISKDTKLMMVDGDINYYCKVCICTIKKEGD